MLIHSFAFIQNLLSFRVWCLWHVNRDFKSQNLNEFFLQVKKIKLRIMGSSNSTIHRDHPSLSISIIPTQTIVNNANKLSSISANY